MRNASGRAKIKFDLFWPLLKNQFSKNNFGKLSRQDFANSEDRQQNHKTIFRRHKKEILKDLKIDGISKQNLEKVHTPHLNINKFSKNVSRISLSPAPEIITRLVLTLHMHLATFRVT